MLVDLLVLSCRYLKRGSNSKRRGYSRGPEDERKPENKRIQEEKKEKRAERILFRRMVH
jgi:hypothetical protein